MLQDEPAQTVDLSLETPRLYLVKQPPDNLKLALQPPTLTNTHLWSLLFFFCNRRHNYTCLCHSAHSLLSINCYLLPLDITAIVLIIYKKSFAKTAFDDVFSAFQFRVLVCMFLNTSKCMCGTLMGLKHLKSCYSLNK